MKKDKKTLIPGKSDAAAAYAARFMAATCVGILVLLPFHAFLTVWAASFVGHYTLLRLWKEILLAVLVMGCVVLYFKQLSGSRTHGADNDRFFRRHPIAGLIAAYLALLVLLGISGWSSGTVTAKAFAYGLLLDARFLIFFVVVWLVSRYNREITDNWYRILLVPAAVVAVFGLLQFTVLPPDFLRHFGYGPSTIDAVQTVDQKAGYQRVQSTLRGANPLGAYLILIIAAAAASVIRKSPYQRYRAALLLAGACLVLAVTFSRSAWLGALAALGWLQLSLFKSGRARQLLLIGGSAALLAFAAIGYSLRQNDVFQNTFLHTDEHSSSPASSNQGHVSAAKQGLRDIARKPLGSGTGTAGPASAYNNARPRIAENYYLQIGQEAGVAGMALFIAINILVGRALWQRRSHLMASALLAGLVGISVVNLLSHAWTDDTLSYIWWGLAGAAMTLPIDNTMSSKTSTLPEH